MTDQPYYSRHGRVLLIDSGITWHFRITTEAARNQARAAAWRAIAYEPWDYPQSLYDLQDALRQPQTNKPPQASEGPAPTW